MLEGQFRNNPPKVRGYPETAHEPSGLNLKKG